MAKSEKSHKLEPRDRSSRVPNDLAFVVYRVVPVGSLSMMLLGTYLKYGFFNGLLFMILSHFITLGFGIGMHSTGSPDFEYCAKEKPRRIEWANTLRRQIEDHVASRRSFPFGSRTKRTPQSTRRGIQRHKERIATYITGSRQGIPPIISYREHIYRTLIYDMVALAGLQLLCGNFPQPFAFRPLLDIFTWQNVPQIFAYCCSFMLWTLFSIQLGRCWAWFLDLGRAGRAIRKACEGLDVEKGGDTRKELEWWIEAILTEESDSPALAQERREVIIVPILNMIRC